MIGAIENAMIETVQAAQDNDMLGYQLKKIDTYGGDLNDEISRVIRNFPAVWFIFIGARKHRNIGRGAVEYIGRFNAIAAADSLRNEKAARHGTEGKVGSYQILLDVIRLLGGKDLGLEISELEPGQITPLVNERSAQLLASVYAVEFTTRFVIDFGLAAPAPDNFETFHANWDVPVLGNVGEEGIPDDDNADATDHITLETQS